MQQTQKVQNQIALLPADPLGARFCKYFSHGWHSIYARVPAPGEKAKWLTETKYPLQPRNLWHKYLDPDIIVGLRFSNEGTRYSLLDVDRGSPYHPINDAIAFKSLLAALEEIGLCRPLVVRSSDSEGLHVYFFLPEPLPTFNLACAMQFAVEERGFKVRQGQLELFPNPKAYSKHKPTDYNGHRLPLQAGSYLLDDDFQPQTSDLGHFLDAADTAAVNQDLDALKEAIAAAAKRPKTYKPAMSTDVVAWERDWVKQISEGWTGSGQTNHLLMVMVAYGKVFERLSGEALVDYAVNTAFAAPGYQQYCRHQHEIRQKAQYWVNSTENNQFYSEYRSYPERLGTYKQTFGERDGNNVVQFKRPWVNSERSEQAQERISRAVETLEALGQFPVGIRAREGAIFAKAQEATGIGVSRRTLHKHLDLWHPAHYKREGVLQVKPALQADSSEWITPSPCSTEIDSLPESPEPLPPLDSSHVDHTPPLMKVSPLESWEKENPQNSLFPRVSPEDISRLNRSSSSGASVSDDKPTLSATPEEQPAALEVQPAAPTAPAAPTLDLKTLSRLTMLRLKAKDYAQKSLREQKLNGKTFRNPEERSHLEQVAKFRFYWESGEPALMREATDWAVANPGVLPEIPVAGCAVAHETATPTVSEELAVAPAEIAPTASKEPLLKAGTPVRYVGAKFPQLQGLSLIISSVDLAWRAATCALPDGYLTTWLPLSDLDLC